ncbi:MAG: alpha/beta hydrolase [Desulfobacteraceae bacterium]|nr:alpha/beta hydrolase [Desulfobacteraceae bacterium]MCB9495212.1 alpha/beta hydrolase [Desulfobacteraceae bacterium]
MKENIVIIHGMWAKGELLSNIKCFFEEKGYNCIAIDLPGRGSELEVKSDVSEYGFLDFVDHAAKIISSLDSKPVVMGHSMGGLITHKLAEMGLVKKAVLITPATQRGVLNFSYGAAMGFLPVALKPFFWKRALEPTKKGFDYICSEVPDEVRDKIFFNLVPESGRAFFEISMWGFDFKKSTDIQNSKIDCPVFQIAGKKDKIISYKVLEKQAELISAHVEDFKFKVYEDHGHGIIWEKGWDSMCEDIHEWIVN